MAEALGTRILQGSEMHALSPTPPPSPHTHPLEEELSQNRRLRRAPKTLLSQIPGTQ